MINNFKNELKQNEKKLNVISYILIPFILFVLTERMYINTSVSVRVYSKLFWINVVIWLLVLTILFSIFQKLKNAIRILTVFMMALGLTNHFLFKFRGNPFQPWDLFSIKTAASVADNYHFYLDFWTIIYILSYILIFFLAGFLSLSFPISIKKHTCHGISIFIFSSILLFSITRIIWWERFPDYTDMLDHLFVQDEMTERNGTAVTLLYDLKFVRVHKPDNYSAQKAEELLQEAHSLALNDNVFSVSTVINPNIIVIMDEAFSDLSIVAEFETNEELIPFTKDILSGKIENTISGYMRVPVLGGNTANTEFEFLTGNSMKYLPQGSIPYQQYIRSASESIPFYLNQNGYDCIAIHPYRASGWNRDKIYKYFGFDTFLSEEDFQSAQYIRNYISDESDFNKIIEIFSNHGNDKPLFIFNVTMQNHGDYWEKFDNFIPNISANNIYDNSLDQYLSLINLSDKALENLVNYFSKYNSPTVIVFFGDHQPADSTVESLYELNGKDINSISYEEIEDRYIVPFIIWANYDIQSSDNVLTESNYLGIQTMELANIDLSDYQLFIKAYTDGLFTEEDYSIVQYYKMFDSKQ